MSGNGSLLGERAGEVVRREGISQGGHATMTEFLGTEGFTTEAQRAQRR